MQTAVIILAAGRGTRVKGALPKQWRMLGDCSVLARCLKAFRSVPNLGPFVLVHHLDDLEQVQALGTDLLLAKGGDTRSRSVAAGLNALRLLDVKNVMIHDGARPFVTPTLIKSLCDALKIHAAVAPAVSVTDALWLGKDGFVTATQSRSELFSAQTPQAFDYATIVGAYKRASKSAVDDVEVALLAGVKVKIIDGSHDNIKITFEEDFVRALTILNGVST
jgi:2-C-methyl-D-erythritol 4-phosphate cytidylyltransferase/2-C-methyl-D-erythritol 2,4-cyclodiphosphate synthase